MKPFIHDLPMARYHETKMISSSEIRLLAAGQTERHVNESRVNKKDPTPAMILGSVTHAVVSGHDEEFVIKDWDARTKEGKKLRDETLAEFPDSLIVTQDVVDVANEMCAGVLANPMAKDIIEGSIKEGSWFWKDFGANFKVRPDFVNDAMKMVADLKTAKDASFRGFVKAVRYGRLDLQAYHQLRGITAHDQTREAYDFSWIVVENTPPYLCTVYPFEWTEKTRWDWEGHAERLAIAQKSGAWPGYEAIGDVITEGHLIY